MPTGLVWPTGPTGMRSPNVFRSVTADYCVRIGPVLVFVTYSNVSRVHSNATRRTSTTSLALQQPLANVPVFVAHSNAIRVHIIFTHVLSNATRVHSNAIYRTSSASRSAAADSCECTSLRRP